jgi:hypothetical protein
MKVGLGMLKSSGAVYVTLQPEEIDETAVIILFTLEIDEATLDAKDLLTIQLFKEAMPDALPLQLGHEFQEQTKKEELSSRTFWLSRNERKNWTSPTPRTNSRHAGPIGRGFLICAYFPRHSRLDQASLPAGLV